MIDAKQKSFKPNFYEVLDVSMSVDEEEIRRAYDRIKQIYSEDSLAVYGLYTAEEIREVREQIEQAFRILIDPENRRLYDQSLISEPVKKNRQLQITIRAREDEDTSLDKDDAKPRTDGDTPQTDDNGEPRPAKKEPKKAKRKPFKRGSLEIPEDVEFTGEYLKDLRHAHNISLRDVSDTTKVSVSNFRLLEDEAWDRLPALVYVKGFIVQYARYLGVDEKRMLDDFVARYDNPKD